MNYQPVIIIGAPRSGTNMLRDVLCSLDGFETWPCDEINYVWRHGNVFNESDELGPEDASNAVIGFIRNEFEKQAKLKNPRFLVEKTCANSLRIGFVNKVLPEAKYIFIYRNGLDSLISAKKRWKAKLDLPYIFKKVKFVPLIDLPFYALRYLYHRVFKIFSTDQRLANWGPRLKDMNVVLAEHDLLEVCAIQWRECVEKSLLGLELVSNDRLCTIAYEEFVQFPKENLSKICQFLGSEINGQSLAGAVVGVSSEMVGKGVSALSESELHKVKPIVENTLKRLGYSI